MPLPRCNKLEDYIHRHIQDHHQEEPVLVSTAYNLKLASGLLMVTATRRFENKKAHLIEAVMTLPVPFNAVVIGMEATVDGRKLKGVASAKVAARQKYEEAIDDGKAAVLHEELLPGIHMISAANVKPGAFIDVETRFVLPLAAVGADFKARIPLTVGEIYGQSPLQAQDQLIANGPHQMADLVIETGGADIRLNGKALTSFTSPGIASQQVSLGGGINLSIANHEVPALISKAADGRVVELSFDRLVATDEACEFDLLLDTSGSMTESDGSGQAKWTSVIEALQQSTEALGLKPGDKINLWTFSTKTTFHGVIAAEKLAETIRRIPFDNMGTQMEEAIKKVSGSREGGNILIFTDGKAWALDPKVALKAGARVSVVLVGEEALEARIGHLASVSGGQMFTCFGEDTRETAAAAIASLRTVQGPVTMHEKRPANVSRFIGGMKVSATWKVSKKVNMVVEGVSQYAAHLAIAGMPEAKASAYAAEEGIVSHLTSLVLVDDAGEAVEGIPAQVKIPLSSSIAKTAGALRGMAFSASKAGPAQIMLVASGYVPPTASYAAPQGYGVSMEALPIKEASFDDQFTSNVKRPPTQSDIVHFQKKIADFMRSDGEPLVIGDISAKDAETLGSAYQASMTKIGASIAAMPVDWDGCANAFLEANVKALPVNVQLRCAALISNTLITDLAKKTGKRPEEIVLGLMAYAAKELSRTADRIQRRLLAGVAVAEVEAILAQL